MTGLSPGGASPDGSPGCSLRAAALIGPSIRRRLARQVRGIVTACERPVVFGPAVPLPRERIAVERERLEALADALDGPDPVEPRGVASVALLLRDGGSPLYRPGNEHDLGQSVQHALDSLAVGSATHTGA